MTAPAKFESTKQPTSDELAGLVANLDQAGLEALQAMIAARLALLGSNEPEDSGSLLPKSNGGEPATAKSPRGNWVELKMIPDRGKLYGPYAYLRWREGGRCRSKYIGKVREVKP